MRKEKRTERIGIAVFAIFLFLPLWVFLNPLLPGPVSPIWAAQSKFLAERHKDTGIECQGCHQENPPGKPVGTPACLGCHGDYTRVAARTEKMDRNPHASHEGNLPCDSCHHAHKASTDHCATCHNYGFKVP